MKAVAVTIGDGFSHGGLHTRSTSYRGKLFLTREISARDLVKINAPHRHVTSGVAGELLAFGPSEFQDTNHALTFLQLVVHAVNIMSKILILPKQT